MSEKIYISPSNQHGNTYAVGDTNEKEQCKKIAAACVSFLKKAGFSVMCTYNDDMYERVSESNKFGADLHVAIHTNATPAHKTTGGSQVLLYDLKGERKKAGNAILKYLAPLTPGSSAERLVAMPEFYEVRAAKGMTMYCECEFHDTKEGATFIIKNTKKIGEAIAKGICDYYGVKHPAAEAKKKPETGSVLYTIQCGAFSVKENAENYLKKVKAAGFDAFIVEKKI